MKYMFLKSLLTLVLLNTCTPTFGQSFEARMMDVKSMQEELTYVQQKLNAVHPEPYHHVSKDTFDRRVERLRSQRTPITTEQWYVHLSALISSLNDGHTALLYNQDERQRYFKQGGTTLPFFAQVTDDKRVVIWHHFTSDSTLRSAQILEMDGRPIEDILQRMRMLTFGESEVFTNSRISGSFARLYWLLYGHSDSVLLTVQLKNGTKKTEKYASISETEYDVFVKRDFPQIQNSTNHHMNLTISDNRSVALLTLNDFSIYKGYKDSVAQVFQSIKEKQIDTLFIDLRDNGGGAHYITEEINHYLLDTPWVLVSKAKIKMSDEFYGVFPKSVRWFAKMLPKKPSLKLAAAVMTKNTKIKKVVKSRDPITKQPIFELYTRPKQHYSKKHLYRGKVYLLTNRNSYSMSGMFAAIMKDYKRAIIVGEETGGLANPHGSNVSVTLPYSKFTFTVSTSRAYRPSGIFDNRGVLPDIQVSYNSLSQANTIEDLLKLVTEVN